MAGAPWHDRQLRDAHVLCRPADNAPGRRPEHLLHVPCTDGSDVIRLPRGAPLDTAGAGSCSERCGRRSHCPPADTVWRAQRLGAGPRDGHGLPGGVGLCSCLRHHHHPQALCHGVVHHHGALVSSHCVGGEHPGTCHRMAQAASPRSGVGGLALSGRRGVHLLHCAAPLQPRHPAHDRSHGCMHRKPTGALGSHVGDSAVPRGADRLQHRRDGARHCRPRGCQPGQAGPIDCNRGRWRRGCCPRSCCHPPNQIPVSSAAAAGGVPGQVRQPEEDAGQPHT
mmetsp:Transcript_24244/g.67407  ORF Transcript_24244/g.67407 Transcript_24244/m.67407 type:complete len:281 (+) Transcript_24244:624-1466(+)